MNTFETVSAIQAYRDRCEDRLAVFVDKDRTIVVVADGAGGTGSGDAAASTVIREVELGVRQIHSANEWEAFLRQLDFRIGDGESTAVVVDLRTFGIAGRSVGDSRAIIIHEGEMTELTVKQNRKPLLGTGDAEPVGFTHQKLSGILLVGSDGFFNYAKPNSILALIPKSEFTTIPRRCIESVRLPSGEYWDDVAIVAVRNRPSNFRNRK